MQIAYRNDLDKDGIEFSSTKEMFKPEEIHQGIIEELCLLQEKDIEPHKSHK